MFKIVLLLTAISGSLAIDNFSKCSTGATPSKVTINHCNQAPCTFYKGDRIIANAEGDAPSDSAKVTSNLDIILAGVRTPYPLPSDVVDACKHIKPGCPVAKGAHLDYTFDMVIDEIPVGGVRVTMELQIKDDAKKNMFCISFPATVFTTPRP